MKLQIKTIRCGAGVDDHDEGIAVVCCEEIDRAKNSEGLHKSRLVSSPPMGINLIVDTIRVGCMILELRELFS